MLFALQVHLLCMRQKCEGLPTIRISTPDAHASELHFLQQANIVSGVAQVYCSSASDPAARACNKSRPSGPTYPSCCAAQAKNVIDHIGDVCRVAVPMFVYFLIMWIATLLVTRKFHSTYEQCVTQSFTASSNNFELVRASTFTLKAYMLARALSSAVAQSAVPAACTPQPA